MNLPGKRRDLLKRYGLGLALAALALLIRGALPVPAGTTIYQLPLAAVVLSGWFGGRGPGVFALLICATGILYWFVPPGDSFSLPPDYALGLGLFICLGLLLSEFSGGRRRAEAEHLAHLRFLESMDRINRAIQGTNDLDQMLGRALDEVLDIFQCDRAVLGRHSGESETTSFTLLAKRERPGFVLDVNLGVEVAADEGLSAMSAELKAARGPVQWVLGSVPPRTAHVLERFGVQSVLSMPIEPKAEPRDYFFVFTLRQCTHPRVWTPEEERLFLEIGRRLGDATTILSTLRDLRASERKFEAAGRIAHVGWWERDYVTERVSLSDEACRIYGVQPVDLAQWHARRLDLIHPEDRSRVAAASEAALGGGPRYDVEYRVVRPDGTVRVVHSQGDVTRDESGRPLRQFGVMQDITELRRAEDDLRASEASLRESEQRYRTLFEKANDAIFLDNGRDEIIEVNERACTLLGYSRAELLGMRVPDLQAPEVRGQAGRVLREEMAKYGSATFESMDLHCSGRRIPVEVTNTGIYDRGENLILSVVRDITERKGAEDKLRESEAYLTEAQRLSHTGSWALDVASNRYVYTSVEFDRIFGFDPQGEAPTREAVLERMHPEDRISWKRILEKSVREKLDTTSQYRIVLPDGRVRHIHTIRRPVVNSTGEVVKLVGTSIDITERKRAEEERERLRRLEAELAHANRVNTLGELTTSIVHEVSQPLGAMMASAAAGARWLAAEPPDLAEARSALENIAADGKRAREVIGRIRALTKREPPQKERLDVNQKILEVLALADHELKSHDIVVRTELDRSLPRVAADRVQLQQVLLNLIVNAIEAMSSVHDRSRELTIVSGQDGPNGVVVEVRDSGTGLVPEGAERVFEAFYTTKAEGIGIGLSISRSIVEAHGGRLWASANEPHGAVFRFSLSVVEEGQ